MNDTDIGDEGSDVERDVFGKYDCETLNSTISKLNDKLRQVLILYYYHDEPTGGIAQMLGISEVAVRSRIFRARKALYGILKGDEDDEI